MLLDGLRDEFSSNHRALELIEYLDRNYSDDGQKNGFEKIVELLLDKLFTPSRLGFILDSNRCGTLASTVDRYFIIKYLVDEKFVDERNLKGNGVDIGCHMGASLDALAMFGGTMEGADCGRFAYDSLGGNNISPREGMDYLKPFKSARKKLDLVSCFNVDWVEDMSGENYSVKLYDSALKALNPGGQVLFTYGGSLGTYHDFGERFENLPDSKIIELPRGVRGREGYVFVASVPKKYDDY